MLKRFLSARGSSTPRYVSTDSPCRNSGAVFKSFLLIALCSRLVFCETVTQGALSEIIKPTKLLKEPRASARSLGKLGSGTIVKIRGERENGFVSVEVEIGGKEREGWVLRKALDLDAQDAAALSEGANKNPPEKEKVSKTRSHEELSVPHDEGLLMRREPTFIYGLLAGGNMTLITDTPGNLYSGLGFEAGGLFGFFLGKHFQLRTELAFSALGGSRSTGPYIMFGFIDGRVVTGFNIGRFEIFALAQYSLGVSVSDLPTALATSFGSTLELSSLWFGGGAAFRIPANDVMDIVIRASYRLNVMPLPVSFDVFSGLVYFEFKG